MQRCCRTYRFFWGTWISFGFFGNPKQDLSRGREVRFFMTFFFFTLSREARPLLGRAFRML